MLKIWSAIVTVVLAGTVCQAEPATPGMLPPVPLPPASVGPPTKQGPPTVHAPSAPPAVVEPNGHAELHGCLAPCCKHDGCLAQIGRFFCYRPLEQAPIHDLCQPYNPQPPLYLYFLHPPVVDGPGHSYPCCGQQGCSLGSGH